MPDEGGGFLLGKAARLSQRRFERLMRESGLPLLEPGLGRVVYLLWRSGELSQSELAERAGLDKSTLALALARLEERGLVLRRPDPEDGRRILVSPSPAARAAHDAHAEVSRKMTDLFYEGFSAEDIGRFEGYLARIIRNLEGEPGRDAGAEEFIAKDKKGREERGEGEGDSRGPGAAESKTAPAPEEPSAWKGWKGWKGWKSGGV